MADDRVVVIDMAKNQAGSDIARAKRDGVKGLPLFGGIVQTSNNNAWADTISRWLAAGLPVATYWWPGWGVPEAEADEAVARHNQAGATGGIMLDLEGPVPDGVNVTDWSQRFMRRTDLVRTNVPGFAYSTRGWLSDHGVDLRGRRFVVAAYGDDRTDPDPPNPDEGAVLWQFTQHGRAPGFDGDVDLNVGHRAQVAALFGTASPTEDLSTVDPETRKYLDDQFTLVRKEMEDRVNGLRVEFAKELDQATKSVNAHGDQLALGSSRTVLDAIDKK